MRKSTLLTLSVALVVTVALAGYVASTADPEDGPQADASAYALSMGQLEALNPAVAAHYGQISPCVPHMGVHYGAVVDGRPAMAPSLVLSLDPVEDRINAFEILVPSDQPWQPWYDQPEGEPLELAPGMSFWTQHIYLVDHSEINECPPMGE